MRPIDGASKSGSRCLIGRGMWMGIAYMVNSWRNSKEDELKPNHYYEHNSRKVFLHPRRPFRLCVSFHERSIGAVNFGKDTTRRENKRHPFEGIYLLLRSTDIDAAGYV